MFRFTSNNNCIFIVLHSLLYVAQGKGYRARGKKKVNASNELVRICDDSDSMEIRDYGFNVSVVISVSCSPE